MNRITHVIHCPARWRQLLSALKAGVAVVTAAVALTACTESFEERCRREAREYTEKQCPRALDSFVTIDSMAYIPNPQGFTYYYTVNDDGEMGELFTEDVKEEFLNQLRSNVRQDISMKSYKEKGFILSYCYRSKVDGSIFMQASFGPEDYR